MELATKLNRRDLLFLVDTLLLWRTDRDQEAERIGADEPLLKTMLEDGRLFERLVTDENILLQVSPWLFFTVLLRRAWRDLAREAFTVEQRGRRKITLFDTDRIVKLLEQEAVRDYLATLLASFTRLESVTVLVETKPGAWRAYHTNELNVPGMIRYSQTLDEAFRFAPYRRLGDACLFLTGLFPEHINNQHRYPASGRVRPRSKSQIVQTLEDYESHGRRFYRLAAEHPQARLEVLDAVLSTLSDNFILARKPLTFMADRYLQFGKHSLFDL
jgi:hypothetical protein